MALSPLNARRWRNFKKNRRAVWSLWIFAVLFGLSLFAEVLANDKPLLVSYRGEWRSPLMSFYSEEDFGGFFKTEATYREIEVQCLIIAGGTEDPCLDDPEGIIAEVRASSTVEGQPTEAGWLLWPPIPYKYNTVNDIDGAAPSAPDAKHWLGTDDTARDVLARVIYGFRLSVAFALIVTFLTSVIGIAAGAIQGFFGGWTDLIFQRVIEVWTSIPALYLLLIISAVLAPSFWVLLGILLLFSWVALVGVVRAEFLRARNFEYVTAAKALGVGNRTIMWRHLLPNAMVATLTFMPFILNGSITTLTSLDFLGFGLPPGSPSLGELLAQGKNNLQAPWLGITGFLVISIMLSLLIFIGEAVRDAFDPRKTFV